MLYYLQPIPSYLN